MAETGTTLAFVVTGAWFFLASRLPRQTRDISGGEFRV